MSRKIGLKELHTMASSMKYYDFENWVAKELFNQPETVDTSKVTDKLFLYNVVGRSEQLKAFVAAYNELMDEVYPYYSIPDDFVDEYLKSL